MRGSTLIDRSFPLVLLTLVLGGCGGDAPAPADAGGGEEAEVLAAAVIDPALFDSIAWPDPGAAVQRGATVYMYSCAKCHGDRGAGDGNYRLNGRLLRPPSFRPLDWQYGDDIAGLREAVYLGSNRGMPHWGNAGLPARDIDAVARYITEGLRSDVY